MTDPNNFICPECGSTNPGTTTHVSTVPDEANPWSSILRRISCADCRATIPAHLAERWDDLPLAAAQKEWQETYRDTQSNH